MFAEDDTLDFGDGGEEDVVSLGGADDLLPSVVPTAAPSAKADEEASLPPGWQAVAARSGGTYYFHSQTSTSTWDVPTSSTPINALSAASKKDCMKDEESITHTKDETQPNSSNTEVAPAPSTTTTPAAAAAGAEIRIFGTAAARERSEQESSHHGKDAQRGNDKYKEREPLQKRRRDDSPVHDAPPRKERRSIPDEVPLAGTSYTNTRQDDRRDGRSNQESNVDQNVVANAYARRNQDRQLDSFATPHLSRHERRPVEARDVRLQHAPPPSESNKDRREPLDRTSTRDVRTAQAPVPAQPRHSPSPTSSSGLRPVSRGWGPSARNGITGSDRALPPPPPPLAESRLGWGPARDKRGLVDNATDGHVDSRDKPRDLRSRLNDPPRSAPPPRNPVVVADRWARDSNGDKNRVREHHRQQVDRSAPRAHPELPSSPARRWGAEPTSVKADAASQGRDEQSSLISRAPDPKPAPSDQVWGVKSAKAASQSAAGWRGDAPPTTAVGKWGSDPPAAPGWASSESVQGRGTDSAAATKGRDTMKFDAAAPVSPAAAAWGDAPALPPAQGWGSEPAAAQAWGSEPVSAVRGWTRDVARESKQELVATVSRPRDSERGPPPHTVRANAGWGNRGGAPRDAHPHSAGLHPHVSQAHAPHVRGPPQAEAARTRPSLDDQPSKRNAPRPPRRTGANADPAPSNMRQWGSSASTRSPAPASTSFAASSNNEASRWDHNGGGPRSQEPARHDTGLTIEEREAMLARKEAELKELERSLLARAAF